MMIAFSLILSCSTSLDPSELLTITFPKSGDAYQIGGTIPIRWSADDSIRQIDIFLVYLEAAPVSRTVALGVPAEAGEFRYTIGDDVRLGPHKIKVRKTGQTIGGSERDEVGPIYIQN